MSKIIDLQVEKCRTLVEGLRRNLGEVNKHGINEQSLGALEAEIQKLQDAGKECDRLHVELSAQIRKMNEIFAGVKENYAAMKKRIKENYLQEEWVRYGVPDKR